MQYRAFMSYSHAADGKLAPALQSGLHRLARPWYRLRALRVFRDKSSLSASPALWPSIETALSESEYFLLLASPEAARSPWVTREVEWWLQNRSVSHLLIVLTDGDLAWDGAAGDFDWSRSSAVPASLRGQLRDEPLYVDLRWAKKESDFALRHSQFRAAVLDLAATLHGKPKDELDGEDVRRYRTARLAAGIAVLAIAASAVTAGRQAYVATRERDAARRLADLNFAAKLAADALNNVEVDPQRSLLLAIDSALLGSKADGRMPEEAESALHLALQGAHEALTLNEHDGFVAGTAFSSDGKQVATADRQHVQIWDVVSGQRIASLPKERSRSLAIAYSPDGRYIATGGRYGEARLWDTSTYEEVRSLPAASTRLWSVAFAPDSARLATAGGDEVARIWDVASGRRLLELRGHLGEATSVTFSADGTKLASAGDDGQAFLWNSSTGAKLLTVSEPGEHFRSVALSPDGKLLALGATGSGAVKLRDTAKGNVLKTLDGHAASVFAVTFTPDGALLATASHDKTIRVWSVATGKERYKFVGHTDGAVSAAFNFDGSRLISGGSDATARIWNVRSETEVLALRGHRDELTALAFSADGVHLATASLDASARIWNAATGEQERMLRHDAAVNGVAFSPDGVHIATAGADQMARVWEARTGRQLLTLKGHEAAVNALVYGRDGTLLATGGDDGSARVWDASTGRERWLVRVANARVVGVDFSPDGRLLATAAYTDGKDAEATTQIWSSETHEPLARIPGDYLWVNRAVFSPDGASIATAGTTPPYTATIWRTSTGKRFLDLSGHAEGILDVAFSPDGTRLASVGYGGETNFWDLATGREISALPSQSSSIYAVRFSPDGKRVALASGRIALIYSLDPNDLLALAMTRVTRAMSPYECRSYLRSVDCKDSISARLLSGRRLLQRASVDDAMSTVRAAFADSGLGDADAKARKLLSAQLLRTGRDYAGMGELEPALASFTSASQIDSELRQDPAAEAKRLTAASLVARAARLNDRSEIDAAVAAYEKALAVWPTAPTYTDLGWVYADQGRTDLALRSANRAKELDDTYVSAYWLAAAIYQDDLNDYEAAYQEALKGARMDSGGKTDLTEACLTSGRYQEAQQLAAELLARADKPPKLSDSQRLAMHFMLSAALLLDGKADEAKRAMAELRDYQKSLAAEFRQTWSYRGTRHFLRTHEIDNSTRGALLGLLDSIDHPTSGAK
jgi:WD40 repeat protein/tetratricopeptide (TPR) repeat protein